ncbi:MAG TPA: hypothetical protein VN613_10435 [Gemmatimonadaceae bacterium]|nr:hypothetical protein [Gemmatimonadaceae bacterium]
MRSTRAGQVTFGLLMAGLGIQGLIIAKFTTAWAPVPPGVPGRAVLVYLIAIVSLACGLGLLWQPAAARAARGLLIAFVIWFIVWRVRALFIASLVEGTWSAGATLVMIAASWSIYAALATEADRKMFGFPIGARGTRIAQILYGIAMIPFGYAHFAYLQHTADLVPSWLPWHLGWAYLTGGAFIAAAIGILFNFQARLAVTLSAAMMGIFGLFVWVPVVLKPPVSAGDWGEFASTVALTIAGFAVAASPPASSVTSPLPHG